MSYPAAGCHLRAPPAPAAAFPNLEWLGLGQLAFLPRAFGEGESSGFEAILERLTDTSCPKLVRLDVLQDVGPLRAALSRLDGVLRCLCLSASVLGHYSKSILGIPSLSTLRIMVDSVPTFRYLGHPSLSFISIYVPAALTVFVGPTTPIYKEVLLRRLLFPIVCSRLPRLRKITLFSEIPLPLSYIDMIRSTLVSRRPFELEYVEIH